MTERWKQRFDNYEKAMRHLRAAVEKDTLSEMDALYVRLKRERP